MIKKSRGLGVDVYNDNFDKAFRQFRKKIQKAGIIQEVRDKQTYTKPNAQRREAMKVAKRNARKELNAAKMPKKYY